VKFGEQQEIRFAFMKKPGVTSLASVQFRIFCLLVRIFLFKSKVQSMENWLLPVGDRLSLS
jgi:hypothetical protein